MVVKRIVETFVATVQWPGEGATRPVASAQPVPDRASSEAHEAVDARCLESMLLWLRRTPLLVPLGLLWTWLAWENGAGAWALAWFAGWAVTQTHVYWTAGQLQGQANGDVRLAIARATRLYWIAGVLHAALLPQFFFGTSIETKLGISLLLTTLSGATVISCSGIRGAYVGVMLPLTAVLVAGWLWHGGVLGYGLAFLFTLGTAGGVTAVSQQRHSWEALVRLADDRERLAASLAAERDRAEAASASRTRFFAAASHDLRQPLHALSINATTLELLAKRAGDARLADISRDIGRSLAQSKGLLDALLDISRLDAGAVQPHPIEADIGGVLHQLHAEFSGVAAQRRLAFELDLPRAGAWARTDVEQLQRVLRNLLDNAFKFTDQGSVTLSLRRERAHSHGEGGDGGAGTLRIGVADTGCGIAEGDRSKVFEEFYQVGNPTRDRNRGLGLGLAIVQRTAELLGARVGVRGNGGRGSVFEIELAALAANERPPPPAPAVVRTNARMSKRTTADDEASHELSVLLVDDETDIVHALAGLMTARGWHAITASSFDAAIAIAGNPARAFDVAVIDHRLPGGDGIELIARLRERRPDLPALIVTGDVAVQWQVRRHGLRVLHKPLDGDVLTKAIAEEAAAAARWAARLAGFTGPNGEPPHEHHRRHPWPPLGARVPRRPGRARRDRRSDLARQPGAAPADQRRRDLGFSRAVRPRAPGRLRRTRQAIRR
jgi:signal transduction histidine kinase/ActR/RegA family two-component response regulator